MPEDDRHTNMQGSKVRGKGTVKMGYNAPLSKDGRDFAATVNTQLPENALTEEDLMPLAQWLYDNPPPMEGVRISLRGKEIAGPLGKLRKDHIAVFDFAGADLRNANAAPIAQMLTFSYDESTLFSDTLDRQIVRNIEKRTGIPMQLVPSEQQILF